MRRLAWNDYASRPAQIVFRMARMQKLSIYTRAMGLLGQDDTLFADRRSADNGNDELHFRSFVDPRVCRWTIPLCMLRFMPFRERRNADLSAGHLRDYLSTFSPPAGQVSWS